MGLYFKPEGSETATPKNTRSTAPFVTMDYLRLTQIWRDEELGVEGVTIATLAPLALRASEHEWCHLESLELWGAFKQLGGHLLAIQGISFQVQTEVQGYTTFRAHLY